MLQALQLLDQRARALGVCPTEDALQNHERRGSPSACIWEGKSGAGGSESSFREDEGAWADRT